MKKYTFYDADFDTDYTLYVGEAQEVKACYRAMFRAWLRNVSNICNAFCDFPKFNYSRCYGLLVNDKEMTFHVVSSDTALRMIADI